jgi:hypothetical protein
MKMKKIFKFIGILLLLLIAAIGIYYVTYNKSLPEGKQGKDADALALRMLNALDSEAYENTEILEWNFQNKHHYSWNKSTNTVVVKWSKNVVHLLLNEPENSMVDFKGLEVKNLDPKIIKQAQGFFNNDSFWLVAPYKIFDLGTERRIVKHNNKDALLITYTSGGTTPGDSYLWILDKNCLPTSFKMWTKIIPLGGVSATWSDWKTTETGIKLPTKHTLSLFGLEINMGDVKSINDSANILANKILKAIKNEAYKKTRFLEWSFGGRRSFKWNKEKNIVDVSWDTIRVNLHPRNKENSAAFFNNIKQKIADTTLVKKAWNIFNNDSFWLVAPHKLFEKGIIRRIQKVDGKDALFVKYTKGGSTPGDSYLWILEDNNIPKSYKMNVPSMKMNEVPATWENWITTESGTLLPTSHTFSSGNKLSMGMVKGYN